MNFRIAATFTDSLAKLRGDEQTAAKTTAFDLQMNPANPGMQLHKLDRAKDKNFWSVRVNSDIRIIVHKSAQGLMLCYVDHHDDAYRWAERRKIERHPTTGAAQIVEIRETVREIEIPRYVAPSEAMRTAAPKPLLFAGVDDAELLGFGVPAEWLDDVKAADEDKLFELAEHLPSEAAEALLELATGSTPRQPVRTTPDVDPFAHPDAQRRFRVVADAEELQRALEAPWDKWTVFLHPAQRETVERRYTGPGRVAGSAGTGKTVVALHRAAWLAKQNPRAKVLLTTFSILLARNLRQKLARLVGDRPHNPIAVRAINEVGLEVYESAYGKPSVPTPAMLRELFKSAMATSPNAFSLSFVESEWNDVVDSWQLDSWEAYRDVARLGRKTRLGEKQREVLWSVFHRVRTELRDRGLVTMPSVFAEATKLIQAGQGQVADFIVVDEAQDVSVPQLRFLAAAAGTRENGLFFAGDLGQRIFQTPFSWASLGVDVRGRSQTLRVNYRTSHQIRRMADRLLHEELTDVDGNTETRKGTVSAFQGPEPVIRTAETPDEEAKLVATWLTDRIKGGVQPHETGVCVRSEGELPRARAALAMAGLKAVELGSNSDMTLGAVSICTMHLAKGLEFRAVVVAACDDEIVPLQSRIEGVSDDSDLEEVYNTERHLLYVACTRARDHLLVSGVEPASEFLDDLRKCAASSQAQ